MERSRKPKRPRVHTFMQLRDLVRRALEAKSQALVCRDRVFARLCPEANGFVIEYRRRATCVPIARVFRGCDGGTVYMLEGIGQEDDSRRILRRVRIWMRYAPLVTPYPVNKRLYEGRQAYFIIRRGIATRCPQPPGVWRARTFATAGGITAWSHGPEKTFHSYPNYTRRCRVFAVRLRQTLVAGPSCVVQLVPMAGWWGLNGRCAGNVVQVCTAPSAMRNGRRLVVRIAMHDAVSKRLHGIDTDYAVRHCHFEASEPDVEDGETLHWKCARDAIEGIVEWVLAGVAVPGPG